MSWQLKWQDFYVSAVGRYTKLFQHWWKDCMQFLCIETMGGAFQKKFVGQNDSVTGCSAMLSYKTRNWFSEETECRNIYICDSFAWLRWDTTVLEPENHQKLVWQSAKLVGQLPHQLCRKLRPWLKPYVWYGGSNPRLIEFAWDEWFFHKASCGSVLTPRYVHK